MLKCSTRLYSTARIAARTAAATSAVKSSAVLAGYPSRSAHSFHTSAVASSSSSLSTPTETLDIRPVLRQQQHTNLPTVQITKDSTSVLVTSPKGSKYYRSDRPTASLNSLWLRDNCPCPKCIDPTTRQKLHASSQVPVDISVSSVQIYPDGLELTWSKGLLLDVDVAVDGSGAAAGGRDEELAKARPGHKSLYPWEMILGSHAGSSSEQHTHEARVNDKQSTRDF